MTLKTRFEMRVPMYCHICRQSIEALVISVKDWGHDVDVTGQCVGRSYMQDAPHNITQRMRLTTYQALRFQRGEGEIP